MSFAEILLLALGLSMDSAAAAAARGLKAREVRAPDLLRIGLLFGAFQAGMPLLGWGLGVSVGPLVEAFDHWIAFGLLAAIGGKMLHEAFGDEEGDAEEGDPFGARLLVTLAIATSIDALAVGVSLPLIGAPLLTSIATIFVVTALVSAAGVLLGRRFGAMLGRRLDALGGVVLIGLGVRILIEHLSA